MPRVIRLETVAEVGVGADRSRISVSARLDAVLDDGRRVVVLDDRGWVEELRGPGAGDAPDLWAATTREHIAATARTVVGPDEPFGGRSQADMEADYWQFLAGRLAERGVTADAAELAQVPHEVVLGQRLAERLR
jgi:hypothetical protein